MNRTIAGAFAAILFASAAYAQDVEIDQFKLDQLREELSAKASTLAAKSMFPHVFFDSKAFSFADGSQVSYRAGTRAIDQHQYEAAVTDMQHVIDAKSQLADAALYWKAYSQLRLGRNSDALSSIAELRRLYPRSSWLNDAGALEMEAHGQSRKTFSPETAGDDDLKLLAINGLMNSDPSRATPLIEKVVSNPNNSPQLRARALFVLARSDSPDARRTVSEMARGAANPDLQARALQYLAATGAKDNGSLFADAYRRSSDSEVKRAALSALYLKKDNDDLLAIAKTESNPALQRQAIYFAGMTGGAAKLVSLYHATSNESMKMAVIDSLTAQRAAQDLVDIARHEKDPKLKHQAVERLSTMQDKAATDYMMQLLK